MEKSIKDDYLRKRYNYECVNSINISKRYREKINPANSELLEKDKVGIRKKIKNNALNELNMRINKGYKGINTNLVDDIIDNILKEMKI